MKNPPSEMASRSTAGAASATRVADMRVKLSILWIFAVLNYIYADVFTALDPSNDSGSIQMNHGVMLGFAVFMETAIVMIPLARLLKYRANRWANVFVGIIHTLAVIVSLFVTGKIPAPHYIFFACAEIVTTTIIVWYAWQWTEDEVDYKRGL